MKLKTIALFSILFLGFTSVSFAAPWKSSIAGTHPSAFNYVDPNVSIVGELDNLHDGEELIMSAGKGGVVHQWFEGKGNEGTVGHHSLWRPLKGENCPNKWIKVETPNPAYGSHFLEDTDYCVKTNSYNPSYNLKNN